MIFFFLLKKEWGWDVQLGAESPPSMPEALGSALTTEAEGELRMQLSGQVHI